MNANHVTNSSGSTGRERDPTSSDRSANDLRTRRPAISVVVPVYNECLNVEPLNAEILDTLTPWRDAIELIYVDDASQDGTSEILASLAGRDSRIRVLRLARNYGQSAAIQAGFDHARGEVLVTLDGDLQNDPRDIPMLLRELSAEHDLIAGWRRHRQDARTTRLLPSRVANWLIRVLTGVAIHDNGCTLRAYRRELVEKNRIYADMHRFMVPILSLSGARYKEVEVHHRPRLHGASKYGLSRIWEVLLDLLSMKMLLRFASHPAAWFAILGLPLLATAIVSGALSLASILDGATGDDVPVILSSISLITLLASVNLLLYGFLAEMVVSQGDIGETERLMTRIEQSP